MTKKSYTSPTARAIVLESLCLLAESNQGSMTVTKEKINTTSTYDAWGKSNSREEGAVWD